MKIASLLSQAGLNRDTAFFARRSNLAARRIVPTTGLELSISEQHFVVAAPLERVFAAYVATPPWQIWPVERIELRQTFAPADERPLALDAPWPGLVPGLRLFADLKIWPIQSLQIMVGVEITRVRPLEEIRYDYLDGSVTIGFNSLHFSAEPGDPQSTHVLHHSSYRGTTWRDRLLMPLLQPVLHVGFVNAMHEALHHRLVASAARSAA